MTQTEKQIPKLITDPEYIKRLFNDRIKEIDSQGREVIKLWMAVYKKHIEERFFHYVIRYNITIKLRNGLRRRYEIFGVSFSGHGRRQMFGIMELVYNSGFSHGKVIIPRPLWYEDQLMTVFYVGVPGDNLLEQIKNGYQAKIVIKNIAQASRQMHTIQPNGKMTLKKHDFALAYLDPTGVLLKPYNQQSSLTQAIIRQMESLRIIHGRLMGMERFILSHGDFHPENVILNRFNSRQAVIIDFSESCLAPRYYDIGSWLEQFDFMTRSYLTGRERQKMENIFIASYLDKEDISAEERNKINLYKSWTALKSAVYFMIFKGEADRGFAEYLVKKSREYIEGK